MNLKNINRLVVAVTVLVVGVFMIGTSGCNKSEIELSGSTSLGGSYWHLTSFKSGVAELPVIPFTKITLFFKPDGTGIYGNAGVNLYGADCVLSADGIAVFGIGTTLMSRLFPPGVNQQEALYLKLLRNSEGVSVSENRLVIHCSGGELRYSRDEVYKYP